MNYIIVAIGFFITVFIIISLFAALFEDSYKQSKHSKKFVEDILEPAIISSDLITSYKIFEHFGERTLKYIFGSNDEDPKILCSGNMQLGVSVNGISFDICNSNAFTKRGSGILGSHFTKKIYSGQMFHIKVKDVDVDRILKDFNCREVADVIYILLDIEQCNILSKNTVNLDVSVDELRGELENNIQSLYSIVEPYLLT